MTSSSVHNAALMPSAEVILQQAPDAIVLFDTDFVARRWNAAAQRVFGHSPESGLGARLALLRKDEAGRRLDGLNAERMTIERLTPDGATITLSVTITHLRDDRGTPQGHIATFRDASLLRRRTDQLRRVSEVAALLAGGTDPDEIVQLLLDAATELTGSDASAFLRIDDASWAITAVSGVPDWLVGYRYPLDSSAPYPGLPLGSALDPADLEELHLPLAEAFGVTGALSVPLPNGDRPQAALGVCRWSPPQATGGTHETCRYDQEDVHVLQSLAGHGAVALQRVSALESERRLRLELEEANRLKDKFLTTVSHELRTPLTVVSGYLRLLRDRGDALDPQICADLVRRADAQMSRLGRLIERLLDMSRVSVGAPPRIHAVDLHSTLRQAADGLGDDVVTIFEAEQMMVLAQPDDLESVLRNLIDNGVKYGNGSQVRVQASRDGSHARIVVEDGGPGIPEDDRGHLFERFYRGTSSDSAPGLGVGLAIVKEFMERMGGSVGYEPREPTGSRFVVTLPLTPAIDPAEGSPGVRKD